MLPEYRKAQLRLWTDLTTLAQPGYATAPATLLAFTAWQDGDGALANVALDRALAENPHHSMAHLLREALNAGAPPSMACLPMTPEEVAACYEEAEQTEETGEQAHLEEPGDHSSPGSDGNGGEAAGGNAGSACAAPAGAPAGTLA